MNFERELATARRAASAAADATMRFSAATVKFSKKDDRTPVTEADLASEKAIVETIRAAFPDDAILSEESGASGSGSSRRWIIDPIDGTRAFMRGLPHWGVIIGFEQEGQIEAGVVHFPALGVAYYAASRHGCWRNNERIHCSHVDDLAEATIQLGEINKVMALGKSVVDEVLRRAAVTRSYGDCYAACLVLEGRSDAWIEASVKTWDVSPFPVLAREAGAVFSNWEGEYSISGDSVFLATPAIHRELVAMARMRNAEC